jgi:hypothetical protein
MTITTPRIPTPVHATCHAGRALAEPAARDQQHDPGRQRLDHRHHRDRRVLQRREQEGEVGAEHQPSERRAAQDRDRHPRPVAYVMSHTSGTEIQNRTDTLTSAGALISFVTGGPKPQMTMTAVMAPPIRPRAGVRSAQSVSPAWPVTTAVLTSEP